MQKAVEKNNSRVYTALKSVFPALFSLNNPLNPQLGHIRLGNNSISLFFTIAPQLGHKYSISPSSGSKYLSTGRHLEREFMLQRINIYFFQALLVNNGSRILYV